MYHSCRHRVLCCCAHPTTISGRDLLPHSDVNCRSQCTAYNAPSILSSIHPSTTSNPETYAVDGQHELNKSPTLSVPPSGQLQITHNRIDS
ncbi:unnamed protein product [Periconia digitata]|uniref:Uncharacterized protein n=1 Tax=Periconia digitata TaxID=1303443 RepID=A0A9W4UIP0_9PLEO|nr:unnamed protein product [Periconia digitata]